VGYHTEFIGEFTLDRKLQDIQATYLRTFSDTRRMGRDPRVLLMSPKVGSEAILLMKQCGLDLGSDCQFYIGDDSEGVVNNNRPPVGQPSLWCQWTPTQDRKGIEWDGGEKFYNYIEWAQYLLDKFLKPWGYQVSGSVQWRGEEFDDFGLVNITNIIVRWKRASIEEFESPPAVPAPTDTVKVKPNRRLVF
jgi:hypothetical protein